MTDPGTPQHPEHKAETTAETAEGWLHHMEEDLHVGAGIIVAVLVVMAWVVLLVRFWPRKSKG